MPGDEDYVPWSYDPELHGPGYINTWEHDCNVGRTAKRAIVAYFTGETREGFSLGGPCEDPAWHRCTYCNLQCEGREDLQEHVRLCASKPPSRSGSRAHAATKRNYTNLHTGLDMEQVRLMYATGDDDAITGGIGCPYLTDAEILGSVVSGDGTYMQAVKTRQAIGRASFNKLYRMFSRSKLPKDLRLRFFESFIASTMHGSSSWVLGATVRRLVNGWAARTAGMLPLFQR